MGKFRLWRILRGECCRPCTSDFRIERTALALKLAVAKLEADDAGVHPDAAEFALGDEAVRNFRVLDHWSPSQLCAAVGTSMKETTSPPAGRACSSCAGKMGRYFTARRNARNPSATIISDTAISVHFGK